MFKKFIFSLAAILAVTVDSHSQASKLTLEVGNLVGKQLQEVDQSTPEIGVSPIRRITRGQIIFNRASHLPGEFRTIDGSSNNLNDLEMGSSNTMLRRIIPSNYGDNLSSITGVARPGPRDVSNIMSAQNESMPNNFSTTDFVWQWGQFLDHDIDLTDGVNPPEPLDFAIPIGDPFFDPNGTGSQTMTMNRSIYDLSTGISSPRQQINEITAWIDGSNIYGSNDTRANELRTLDGTGRLKTSSGNLLPFNTNGMPNAGGPSDTLFLAGDVRANEQVGLTAMHTLFVREHNRIADLYALANPGMTGDNIYQYSRSYVGALLQKITYEDFIPLVLGNNALSDYSGYDSTVDSSISNTFSTAVYRWGHSALSPQIMRLDAQGTEITSGHLPLRDAFFAPHRILNEGGIDPILRGLASQQHQTVDTLVIDDIRNFLFGEPGQGGLDLVALNIQRGRDHGLPDYNTMRGALGLTRVNSFEEISSNPLTVERLEITYALVDDIDAWIGGLSEDPVNGGMVGITLFTVMKEQFEALRDGDRFWYAITLDNMTVSQVNNTTLTDIIRRNTQIDGELQDNVFVMKETVIDTAITDRSGSGSGFGISIIGFLILIFRNYRGKRSATASSLNRVIDRG